MIKRTLYFGNPVHLRIRNEQLEINIPHAQGIDKKLGNTVPVEDIGVVIIDHSQITITHAVLHTLLDNNVAFITCDATHHPVGMMLNLSGNTLQQQRFSDQIEASEPLKKQLWQQTVKAKIKNQAAVLSQTQTDTKPMLYWAGEVTSGDALNHEARAAAYYWKNLFEHKIPQFTRERYGDYPNTLLNYGYTILRATVARGLVSSGLLPTFGIHHRNKYNAYCLADDIMEPYRPYVDQIVLKIVNQYDHPPELTTDIKRALLNIPAMDIEIDGNRSPLMVGLQRTTASLARCFAGESRKLVYPEMS